MAEGKKGRKVGRNKERCKAYRTSQRREFNKARRLIKHLRVHRNNESGWAALEKLDGILYGAQRSALGVANFLKEAGR